jgi:hypothetical protein
MRNSAHRLLRIGWRACFAATATLFVVALIKQILHPDGLTPANLAACVLIESVHLAFIIAMSAIPASVVIWATEDMRVRSLVGSVAVFARCAARRLVGSAKP